MPNGDLDWGEKQLPILEIFFSTVEEPLAAFASRHNLKIEKYHRQKPGWDFLFQHPCGGVAKIDVQKYDEASGDKIQILGLWWCDDYESETRHSKDSHRIICKPDDSYLITLLEDMLKCVLSWSKADLTARHVGPYVQWKKWYSKDEFEKEEKQYPIPR